MFEIQTGERIHGEFPAKAERLVREWIDDNREQLRENWALAEAHKPLEQIPGADQ